MLQYALIMVLLPTVAVLVVWCIGLTRDSRKVMARHVLTMDALKDLNYDIAMEARRNNIRAAIGLHNKKALDLANLELKSFQEKYPNADVYYRDLLRERGLRKHDLDAREPAGSKQR